MWQIYSLGSLLAGAFEGTIDKAGLVHDSRVDSSIASFLRVMFFVIATLAVGITGILGHFSFFFHWSIPLFACSWILNAILFTRLCRTIEITAISATAYLTSFLFLGIDTALLGVQFTSAQLLGMALLVCGGIAFALDGTSHHIKREFTMRVMGSFFFIYIFQTAIETYTFKYFAAAGLNGVSFYGSIGVFAVIFFFLFLVYRRKAHLLVSKPSVRYLPYAIVGKIFDAFNSILFLSAVSLATVSQVTAFTALGPLIVFVVASVTQSFFGVSLRERLDRKNALWKLGATAMLIFGGFLIG